MKIIDGKKLAESIKDEVVAEIILLNNNDTCANTRPGLAIVLVGEKPDSSLYVSLKEKEAKKCGVDTHLYKFGEEVEEGEIKDTIKFLNEDENISAILLQLPLPKKFNTDEIVRLIDPKKDIDRFHPDNLKKLTASCDNRDVMPPLFQVIFEIFDSVKYDIAGKEVCILANSDIFGVPLKKVLECSGAKVKVVNPKKNDWQSVSKKADVLITAVGKKHFIKFGDVKEESFIIDIGITSEGKKVFGDVDMEDVQDKVEFITPVPGGVGPMTIAMALKNVLKLYKNNSC